MAQAATHPANQRLSQLHDAVGCTAGIHQFAGQNEEGKRQQGVGVHSLGGHLDETGQGHFLHHKEYDRDDGQGKGHRHVNEHQRHNTNNHEKQHGDLLQAGLRDGQPAQALVAGRIQQRRWVMALTRA